MTVGHSTREGGEGVNNNDAFLQAQRAITYTPELEDAKRSWTQAAEGHVREKSLLLPDVECGLSRRSGRGDAALHR